MTRGRSFSFTSQARSIAAVATWMQRAMLRSRSISAGPGHGVRSETTQIEAARTPELKSYMEEISGAVNYVNQTFSLFKEAEKRRPAKLLTPKT